MFVCNICQYVGPFEDFKKDSSKPFGIQFQCLECRRKYKNKYQSSPSYKEMNSQRGYDIRSFINSEQSKVIMQQFNNKCFKCGNTKSLTFDHHIPFVDGGRYIKGNVVVLCIRCNLLKGDKKPNQFYNAHELSHLSHILYGNECGSLF